jgi:hypothetical protein
VARAPPSTGCRRQRRTTSGWAASGTPRSPTPRCTGGTVPAGKGPAARSDVPG